WPGLCRHRHIRLRGSLPGRCPGGRPDGREIAGGRREGREAGEMLLYTIVPEDVIFGDDEEEEKGPELRYVGPTGGGAFALVTPVGDGTGRIVRWISSNPGDYLDPSLAPGRLVRLPGGEVETGSV